MTQNGRPGSHPVRYEMMKLLMDDQSMPADEFAAVLAAHSEFILAGGGGGPWETFVTTGGLELGTVLGVYVGAGQKVSAGAQAQLSNKRLDGLNLKGVELPYANLCGVACAGQDLTGANLEGSLWVDADLTGSVLHGANLTSADLSRSDMQCCDLREANLTQADLQNADLRGADLRGAILDGIKVKGAYIDLPKVEWTGPT